MVDKLVDASRQIEQIYWRQFDPAAIPLYNSLAASSDPRDEPLRRYLWINGSRFDLLDEHKPFVGTDSKPPGGALYPKDLTRGGDRGLRQDASAAEGGDLLRADGRRARRPHAEDDPVPRPVQAVAGEGGPRPPRRRGPLRLSVLRELPSPPGESAPDGRLLRERRRLGGPRRSEVRPDPRALRDVPRRPARREGLLRGRRDDSQRRGEREARRLPEVRPRDPGVAAARRRGQADAARAPLPDGSDGHALPRRRPPPRIPGGRRQPPERPEDPREEGQQADLLRQLHERAGQRGDPPACRSG